MNKLPKPHNIKDRPTPESDAERRRVKRSKSFPSEPVDVKFARNLERQRAALREALEPFVELLQSHHAKMRDDQPVFGINKAEISVGQLRAAHATLAATKPKP
jgi:hypothetical protein